MSLTTFIQRSTLVVGTVGLLGAGSLAIANPAQSATLNLSTWTRIGDAVTSPTQATLTNAAPGGDPGDIGAGPNVSGQFPLTVFGSGSQNFAGLLGFSTANFNLPLGIGPFGTPVNVGYREGSAIRTTLTANAGDIFSFNWALTGTDPIDVGFVKVNNSLLKLTGSSPFSYTFTSAGNYDIAVGVVDVNDFSRSSVLSISGVEGPDAIPTPALLPGLIGLSVNVFRKRNQSA
jgi:hypothetical protein